MADPRIEQKYSYELAAVEIPLLRNGPFYIKNGNDKFETQIKKYTLQQGGMRYYETHYIVTKIPKEGIRIMTYATGQDRYNDLIKFENKDAEILEELRNNSTKEFKQTAMIIGYNHQKKIIGPSFEEQRKHIKEMQEWLNEFSAKPQLK
jgi:hypothetical protein